MYICALLGRKERRTRKYMCVHGCWSLEGETHPPTPTHKPHTHIHAHRHVYAHTYIRMHAHTRTHTHSDTRTITFTCTSMYTSSHKEYRNLMSPSISSFAYMRTNNYHMYVHAYETVCVVLFCTYCFDFCLYWIVTSVVFSHTARTKSCVCWSPACRRYQGGFDRLL